MSIKWGARGSVGTLTFHCYFLTNKDKPSTNHALHPKLSTSVTGSNLKKETGELVHLIDVLGGALHWGWGEMALRLDGTQSQHQ